MNYWDVNFFGGICSRNNTTPNRAADQDVHFWEGAGGRDRVRERECGLDRARNATRLAVICIFDIRWVTLARQKNGSIILISVWQCPC